MYIYYLTSNEGIYILLYIYICIYIYDDIFYNIYTTHFHYYIVDFRSATWLPYIRILVGCRYRHALRANILGRAFFFSYGASLRFVLNE